VIPKKEKIIWYWEGKISGEDKKVRKRKQFGIGKEKYLGR